MFENRIRRHLEARRPVASTAGPPSSATFAAAPAAPAIPAAMAEVYRLAYEAAIARVVARRRCFAPFSLN